MFADLAAELGTTVHEVVPVRAGRNNQAFRLETPAGPYFVKRYFRHPADPRDRLAAEYGFLRYAAEIGVKTVARPFLAKDEEGVAVYEFLEGRRVHSEELTEQDLEAVLGFLRAINESRARAHSLPLASEACLTVEAHYSAVRRRLDRLAGVDELKDFVAAELEPIWRAMPRPERAFPEERWLSPSDFGFHNALRTPSQELRFVDFEYAGWDDPAKLLCDFFWQPEVPVPRSWWPALSAWLTPEGRARARLLMPLHGLKWACIVAQSLAGEARARREFSGAAQEDAGELAKARCILTQIGELPAWLT